MLMRNWF